MGRIVDEWYDETERKVNQDRHAIDSIPGALTGGLFDAFTDGVTDTEY